MQFDCSDEFEDEYGDDSSELLPCPQCGAEIYEDSEQCPHCGQYITHSSGPWLGRSAWWIVLGLLGMVAVILALSLGF